MANRESEGITTMTRLLALFCMCLALSLSSCTSQSKSIKTHKMSAKLSKSAEAKVKSKRSDARLSAQKVTLRPGTKVLDCVKDINSIQKNRKNGVCKKADGACYYYGLTGSGYDVLDSFGKVSCPAT
jgi:hypothetical protein